MGLIRFIRSGGRIAWSFIGTLAFVVVATTMLFANTLDVRYRRDISRIVYNHNTGLLDQIQREIGESSDSLNKVLASSPDAPTRDKPYVVVSIADHRLWYKLADSTIFTTQVATGSGKILEKSGGGSHWRFETPRGRLVVESKESEPEWVPPDWHFVEQAQKRGLGLVHLTRGQSIPMADGSQITVDGSDVVRRYADGRSQALEASEGKEIVANGNIVIPPFGTRQRKYKGVLGTFRLNLGDGYALHGTDAPYSIGHSVSHGCVRLRNEDIETLFNIVPVGTPVFIY
ncbi:MAG TPA: L,D-transpeptidase [Gemmatimonadaceae bacterium]|jgi:lipoprotein-anchoring transpeptidase ErfK/SrfK